MEWLVNGAVNGTDSQWLIGGAVNGAVNGL